MNNSPLRAHRQRLKAKQEQQQPEAQTSTNATVYELHLAQLHDHQRMLKKIKPAAEKAAYKAKHIGEFDGYVQGVLEADSGRQDLVVTTIMVWAIDCGHWDDALQLFEYALNHGLALPEKFKREVIDLVPEEMATVVLEDLTNMTGNELLVLAKVLDIVNGQNILDQVLSKLHKAIGLLALQIAGDDPELGALQSVREHLQLALKLDPQAGVKKVLERLQSQIKKATPSQPPEDKTDEQEGAKTPEDDQQNGEPKEP